MRVPVWTRGGGQSFIDPEGLAGALLEGALGEGHGALELAAALELARDALLYYYATERGAPDARAEFEVARTVAAQHRAAGRHVALAGELNRRLTR